MNEYEIKKFKRKIANRNKIKPWQKIFVWLIGVILLALTGVIASLLNYQPKVETKPPAQTSVGSLSNMPDTEAGTVKRKEGVFNFLAVGCDKISLSTDSIMIVSYDTVGKTVALAQLPRDSYVQIKGKDGRKLNSVFAKGYVNAKSELNSLKKAASSADKAKLETISKNAKIQIDADTLKKYAAGTVKSDEICTQNGMVLLENVLEDTLGITIDYSVFLDLEGFRNVVDIIGGVDLNVPRDMDYDDPDQDLHIHLKKGSQKLNGDKAEQFVRFRHGYANADLGRIDAQKLFLTAFFKKIVSTSSITKMPKLIDEFNKYVKTDVKLPDAVFFGKSALSLDIDSIQMITWPGVPKYYNGVSYFSMNKPQSIELVNESFNVYNADVPTSSCKIFELVKGEPSQKSVSAGTTNKTS